MIQRLLKRNDGVAGRQVATIDDMRVSALDVVVEKDVMAPVGGGRINRVRLSGLTGFRVLRPIRVVVTQGQVDAFERFLSQKTNRVNASTNAVSPWGGALYVHTYSKYTGTTRV